MSFSLSAGSLRGVRGGGCWQLGGVGEEGGCRGEEEGRDVGGDVSATAGEGVGGPVSAPAVAKAGKAGRRDEM